MSSNEEKMRNHYKSAVLEDTRFSQGKASRMESYYTKNFISEYISSETSVIEIGCGTGHYGMYLASRCKSYLGIDITPENIEMFNKKITDSGAANIKAQIGDATRLENIEDRAYDVVLVLGPIYHLPPTERDLVFKESKRICIENGIVIYAYINKAGAYLTGCLSAPTVYPNKNAGEIVLSQGTDDIYPDIFFFTMPEEIEGVAVKHGLKVIKNVGVNFAFNASTVNSMSDEQLEAWMELSDYMSNSPSCTGVSSHSLLICKNIKG